MKLPGEVHIEELGDDMEAALEQTSAMFEMAFRFGSRERLSKHDNKE